MAKVKDNIETGYTQPAYQIETKRYCMTLELKDDPGLF